jgi:hypothetical protein
MSSIAGGATSVTRSACTSRMFGVPMTAVGVRSGTRYSDQPDPDGSVTPFRTTYCVSVRLTTYRLTLSFGPWH